MHRRNVASQARRHRGRPGDRLLLAPWPEGLATVYRGLVALATAVLIPTTATQLARACTPPCAESPAGHGGGSGSPSSSSTPAPNGSQPRQRATSAPYRSGGQHPAQPHARQQPRPPAPPSPSPSPTP
jgi:hypothetical protein